MPTTRRTTRRSGGLFSRLRGRQTVTTTTTTTTSSRRGHGYGTTTAVPVTHHRRKTTLGDKVSGAMMKLRGTVTGRPGLKVSLTSCGGADAAAACSLSVDEG